MLGFERQPIGEPFFFSDSYDCYRGDYLRLIIPNLADLHTNNTGRTSTAGYREVIARVSLELYRGFECCDARSIECLAWCGGSSCTSC